MDILIRCGVCDQTFEADPDQPLACSHCGAERIWTEAKSVVWKAPLPSAG